MQQKASEHNADALTPEELNQGRLIFAGACDFTIAAPHEAALPAPSIPEIAFAGRSNVGKSSLVNALTNRKTLARTSKTPGRTQELIYFDLGNKLYLVDTPGYGYAKASKTKISSWTKLIKSYLAGRVPLKRVYLLIDARHGIKETDRNIMEILDKSAASYHIIYTKSDKVKQDELKSRLARDEKSLLKHPAAYPTIHITSADKKIGLEALRSFVASYIYK